MICRGDEEPFFIVLLSDDIWIQLKRWIKYYYQGKKTSNFYDYRSGDLVLNYNYFGLILENPKLDFTIKSLSNVNLVHNIDILLFIYETKLDSKEYIVDDIVEKEHIFIVKILTYHLSHPKVKYTKFVLDKAVSIGNLQIVKILHRRGFTTTKLAIDIAAEKEYLQIVRYLSSHTNVGCTSYAMNMAAKNGYLDTVKFLHTNLTHYVNILEALQYAKDANKIKVVNYLLSVKN